MQRPHATVISLLVLLGGLPSPVLAGSATTARVSVTVKGKPAVGLHLFPVTSASGRYVAFHSGARKIVKRDKNFAPDVFVHDRKTGKTKIVSVSSSGKRGNQASEFASISGDGRFVAFQSTASNLVEGDTNGSSDVFVHDRETRTTERVSVSSTGEQGNALSTRPAISADGRFVAFNSLATNLVEGDENGFGDVFVHDRQTRTTTRVNVSSSGEEAREVTFSLEPNAISADGRLVTFSSNAPNLVDDDSNAATDVFVHDRTTGATTRVSVDSMAVEGNDTSDSATISADGRFVAFRSRASNLVEGDTNERSDVFLHNLKTSKTKRVSLGPAGAEANGDSFGPVLSANGHFVAFFSNASNLVEGDTNDAEDVFVHDRKKGRTRRVSVGAQGVEGDGDSQTPHLAANGKFVVFESMATNLVGASTNPEHVHVYVRGSLR